MFPYSVPFSCKISKNILEWILTTKCKSFWAKIGIKKYQIKFNKFFFKILFIATFVYLILLFMLNVSSFLQDFKKIFWVKFRKHEQAFGQIWTGIPQFGPSSKFFLNILNILMLILFRCSTSSLWKMSEKPI